MFLLQCRNMSHLQHFAISTYDFMIEIYLLVFYMYICCVWRLNSTSIKLSAINSKTSAKLEIVHIRSMETPCFVIGCTLICIHNEVTNLAIYENRVYKYYIMS